MKRERIQDLYLLALVKFHHNAVLKLRQYSFIFYTLLSPPVQVARWALMRHFLSVHLSVCVYSGYIMHHYNGIWGTCAPAGCKMHHQGAICTMVHKGDYIF